jgi:hypothetical protein
VTWWVTIDHARGARQPGGAETSTATNLQHRMVDSAQPFALTEQLPASHR